MARVIIHIIMGIAHMAKVIVHMAKVTAHMVNIIALKAVHTSMVTNNFKIMDRHIAIIILIITYILVGIIIMELHPQLRHFIINTCFKILFFIK